MSKMQLCLNAIHAPEQHTNQWATLTMLSVAKEPVSETAKLALGCVLSCHLIRLLAVNILTLDDRAIIKVAMQHGNKLQAKLAKQVLARCKEHNKKLLLKCLT